jgi:hypothetical protein
MPMTGSVAWYGNRYRVRRTVLAAGRSVDGRATKLFGPVSVSRGCSSTCYCSTADHDGWTDSPKHNVFTLLPMPFRVSGNVSHALDAVRRLQVRKLASQLLRTQPAGRLQLLRLLAAAMSPAHEQPVGAEPHAHHGCLSAHASRTCVMIGSCSAACNALVLHEHPQCMCTRSSARPCPVKHSVHRASLTRRRTCSTRTVRLQ